MATKPRKEPQKPGAAPLSVVGTTTSPVRRTGAMVALGVIMGVFFVGVAGLFGTGQKPAVDPKVPAADAKKAEGKDGMQRVIVTLKDLGFGEAAIPAIKAAQDKLISELGKSGVEVVRRYDRLPQLALSVNDAVLALLKSHPLVAKVDKDETAKIQTDAAPKK